jgi:hypothetical protein
MGTRLTAAAAALFLLAACTSSSDSADDLRRECDALGASGAAFTFAEAERRFGGFPATADCPPFGENDLPRLLPLRAGDPCPYDTADVCKVSYVDTFSCSGSGCAVCDVRVVRPAGLTGDTLSGDAPICATEFSD